MSTYEICDEEFNLDEHDPCSRSLGDLYHETLEELLTPYPSVELPGWSKLNQLIGGFRMREFTILCGGTGAGKTTLLANWAKSLLLAGKRSFVMSVETGHTDFVKRTMSAFFGKDLNRGNAIDPDTLRIFHEQHGNHFTQDGLFLSLYDNRINHIKVLKDILWHKEKKKCDIVFIDNLNFLLEVVSQNRQIEIMDKVVHDLIMFTKRHDVHIVMVMHPKKNETQRVESEFDIKGSSTAVQEAHNVLLFNRPRLKDIQNETRGLYTRELMVRKLRRRGEAVGKSLWLKYGGASYQEMEIENSTYS